MALCNLEEWAFRGRNAMSDITRSECSGKDRGSQVGQKHFEKAKKESPVSLRYTSMPVSVSGDSGIDRITTAAASLVLGSSNIKNKEG